MCGRGRVREKVDNEKKEKNERITHMLDDLNRSWQSLTFAFA